MAGHVLIIEKSARTRKKLAAVSDGAGLTAHAVSSWRHARPLLKRRCYDVIIIPVGRARAPSIEAIRTIRLLGHDSCILITTPLSRAAEAVDCLGEGAYDTIFVPVNAAWAKITLVRALERRRYYDEAQQKDLYRRLSIFDELTRLHNHRYFHYSFERALNSARRYRYPLSVMLMDIDDFKRYNDRYGHLCGDGALRTIGSLISNTTRFGDMAARYGGEEFAIILPHTEGKGAAILAERLRRVLEDASFANGRTSPPAQLTASIGIASFPADARTKDDLLRKADLALYRAKRRGKNRVCR